MIAQRLRARASLLDLTSPDTCRNSRERPEVRGHLVPDSIRDRHTMAVVGPQDTGGRPIDLVDWYLRRRPLVYTLY